MTNAGGFGRVQYGGAERAIEELSAGFAADERWKVAVIAPPEFLTQGRFAERVTRHPIPLSELTPSRALLARSALRTTLRELRPDVVLTHLLRGTLVGVPAARLATRAGVISILHNSLHDSQSGLARRGARHHANVLAFALVGRLASAHVAIAESNARDLVRLDHQSRRRVHLIHNWVSPEFLEQPRANGAATRAQLGIPGDAPTIVVAGRLERQKRQDFAIRLLARLPGAWLVLLGEGTLGPSYAALAHSLGVQDRVRMVGFRRDVAAILAAADVVAVPSAFEGFGRVAVESLAVGTPVAASDVAGLRDALRGAPAGAAMLLAPDDAQGWVAGLRRLVGDPPSDEARGRMRAWAAGRYSFESRLAAYRRLVCHVAGSSRPDAEDAGTVRGQ